MQCNVWDYELVVGGVADGGVDVGSVVALGEAVDDVGFPDAGLDTAGLPDEMAIDGVGLPGEPTFAAVASFPDVDAGDCGNLPDGETFDGIDLPGAIALGAVVLVGDGALVEAAIAAAFCL